MSLFPPSRAAANPQVAMQNEKKKQWNKDSTQDRRERERDTHTHTERERQIDAPSNILAMAHPTSPTCAQLVLIQFPCISPQRNVSPDHPTERKKKMKSRRLRSKSRKIVNTILGIRKIKASLQQQMTSEKAGMCGNRIRHQR